MQHPRPPQKIGDVWLSVQAGGQYYSIPETENLALDQYQAVEVSLLSKQALLGWGTFVTPKEIGLPEYQHLWDGTSARYIHQEDLAGLRTALEDRAKAGAIVLTGGTGGGGVGGVITVHGEQVGTIHKVKYTHHVVEK